MQNHARPTRLVLMGNEVNNLVEGSGDQFTALGDHPHGSSYEISCAQDINEIVRNQACFDVILLDLSRRASGRLAWLEQVRKALPSIPVIAIVSQGAGAVQQQALRMGAWKTLTKETLNGTTLVEAVRGLTAPDYGEIVYHQERILEEALGYLQQQPATTNTARTRQSDRMRPLSEAMPHKFLELTKSYSNLLDLALSRTRSGLRFNGYSVSRRLHFLASDLGAVRAGVWDVIDMHAKAIDNELATRNQANHTSHKILLELMSDLVSYYKHSGYAPA